MRNNKLIRNINIIIMAAAVLSAVIAGFVFLISGGKDGPKTAETVPAAKLISFDVEKPDLVVRGYELGRVEIFAVISDIAGPDSPRQPLGEAGLAEADEAGQKWTMPIPGASLLASEVFATGFDRDGKEVGSLSLPFRGVKPVFTALWSPSAGGYVITAADHGQTFVHSVGDGFRVKLDGRKNPMREVACLPAGIATLTSIFPAHPPGYYADFKTDAAGTCDFRSGDIEFHVRAESEFAPRRYVNEEFGFAVYAPPFSYEDESPAEISAAGKPLLKIDLARNEFTGTNLREAAVTFGADGTGKVLCSTSSPARGEIWRKTVFIDGVEFGVFDADRMEENEKIQNRHYRAEAGGICYEIVALTRFKAIDAFAPGEVTPFERGKCADYLEAIVGSFMFTE